MDFEPATVSRKRSWNSSDELLNSPVYDGRSSSPLKKVRHVNSASHLFNAANLTSSPALHWAPYLSTSAVDTIRAAQMTPPPVDYSPAYSFPPSCHVKQASPSDTLMTDAYGQPQVQVELSPPSPESDADRHDERLQALRYMEQQYQQQQQESYEPSLQQREQQPRVLDIRGQHPGHDMRDCLSDSHGADTLKTTGGHRRFRMGYMPGCQQCLMKVPGHYSHI